MSAESVTTRLSLAALVIDSSTKEAIRDAVVSFPDLTEKPPSKVTADGYHVFTRLPPGPLRLHVAAAGYKALDTTTEIPKSPTLADSVRELWLDPDPVDGDEERQ